ncbi:MAG: PQQ-binding-like beta-propeller repeat protein [Salinigranum sp.]
MATDDGIDYSKVDGPEDRMKQLGTVEVNEAENPGEFHGDVSIQQVTDGMLAKNDANSWLQYNGPLEQTGYSPAERLTPDNVDGLTRQYAIETSSRGLETDPIVVPGDPPVMYFTQHSGLIGINPEKQESHVVVWAVNARSGETIWKYKYNIANAVAKSNEAIGVNRGVAPYGDKVYLATMDTQLVAINAKTGKKEWQTDLLMDGQFQARTSFTEAPVTYDGKVFIGQAGDAAGWSAVQAVDAKTGDIKWEQPTMKKDAWVGETWRFSSASGWMSPAVDPQSDTVFWSLGNPNPMMNGLVRPGANQYSDSIMALDTDTGDIKWNHQVIPHELWDYDIHCTPFVFDMEVDGEKRRVVAQDWKAGWTYMVDVETGELIERSAPFARQGGETFLKMPPAGEDNAETTSPTTTGGTEWPPDAYSPKTGLHYLGANNATMKMWYDPTWAWGPDNYDAFGGGTNPVTKYNTAEVVAMDPASGSPVWKHRLEDIDTGWPSSRLFTGGTTATGGNLVFHGSSGGHMIALDARTGQKLWQDDTGGRITASPIVWDDPKAGKQFVAIASDNKVIGYASD